ncbi:MAG: hypothetical protein R3327_03890 [Nitrosopumilaceae archaeon]|nr:hypothetical protein [Nitrosopumilaceae archaeon]
MSWIVVLPVGIIIGILFSSAYPEMASGINDVISPPIQAVGESLTDRIKDGVLSIMGT